ncbi:MAG: hypothetical protein SNJ56_03140 [Termitinemataceae bacterium]
MNSKIQVFVIPAHRSLTEGRTTTIPKIIMPDFIPHSLPELTRLGRDFSKFGLVLQRFWNQDKLFFFIIVLSAVFFLHSFRVYFSFSSWPLVLMIISAVMYRSLVWLIPYLFSETFEQALIQLFSSFVSSSVFNYAIVIPLFLWGTLQYVFALLLYLGREDRHDKKK